MSNFPMSKKKSVWICISRKYFFCRTYFFFNIVHLLYILLAKMLILANLENQVIFWKILQISYKCSIYHMCASRTKNTLKHVNDFRETLTTHHQKKCLATCAFNMGKMKKKERLKIEKSWKSRKHWRFCFNIFP